MTGADPEECIAGGGNSKREETEAGVSLVGLRSRSAPRCGRVIGYEVREGGAVAIK